MDKPIAIITGASTGIGKSLSVKLSKQYLVYLISRNQDNLNKTKKLIEAQNNECKIIVADISQSESINMIYSQIEHKEKISSSLMPLIIAERINIILLGEGVLINRSSSLISKSESSLSQPQP